MKYEIEIHPVSEKPMMSGEYLALNSIGHLKKRIYVSESDCWYEDLLDRHNDSPVENDILFWIEALE